MQRGKKSESRVRKKIYWNKKLSIYYRTATNSVPLRPMMSKISPVRIDKLTSCTASTKSPILWKR